MDEQFKEYYKGFFLLIVFALPLFAYNFNSYNSLVRDLENTPETIIKLKEDRSSGVDETTGQEYNNVTMLSLEDMLFEFITVKTDRYKAKIVNKKVYLLKPIEETENQNTN